MNQITNIKESHIDYKKNKISSNKKQIVAMVPVRSGSTRVLNKNIRPFADSSLLELKLKLLKNVRGLSQIVVSTDCEKSAEIACQNNVNVQWRNKYFAGSKITNDEHWLHIAETTPGDVVFLSQVTSPLLRVSTMQSALDSFLCSENYDSINSVTIEKKFLWKGDSPLNYKYEQTPKSQDLPDIFSLNFAITIIKKQEMITQKNVVGTKPKFITLDKAESIDIDDTIDFKIAELMYKEMGIKWLIEH